VGVSTFSSLAVHKGEECRGRGRVKKFSFSKKKMARSRISFIDRFFAA
jgi:hypothetical protein